MQTKLNDGFNTRVLMALLTKQAERDAIDADIRVMIASLAKAHGLPSPYPPVTS